MKHKNIGSSLESVLATPGAVPMRMSYYEACIINAAMQQESKCVTYVVGTTNPALATMPCWATEIMPISDQSDGEESYDDNQHSFIFDSVDDF